MPKFTVKIDDKELRKLQRDVAKVSTKAANQKTAKKIGVAIIALMKIRIARGLSPIRARRAFSAYRGSYRKRIAAGRIPRKSLRPVNLKLSGKFLKQLRVFTVRRGRSGSVPVIGFRDGSKAAQMEDGHRRGTNRQARRPIIPTGRERFTKSIELRTEQLYAKSINKILKKLG